MTRKISLMDKFLMHADLARKTLSVKPRDHVRENPAKDIDESELTAAEKKHAAGLMRVNHTGEVCAQALYQGQAITARSKSTMDKMQEAAHEELDHLAWCNQRLSELDSRSSYLDPLWYAGALSIGITAGLIGDKWSLGFLAETEQQVVDHLDSHLGKLPDGDHKSRTIVKKMSDDEAAHRDMANDAGARVLPGVIKKLMKMSAKVMTKVSYKL